DCRDRVRRIVEPVEEVEREDDQDRDDDYREGICHVRSVPPRVPPLRRERPPTPSLILRYDIAQDVGDVLAVIRGLLEDFRDLLELDDRAGILVSEEG